MKKVKIALVAGHTTIPGRDRGAQKYVIEGIANRQQMLACASELKKRSEFEVFVEPEGLALEGEITWVNKVKPDIAIAFHNNAGGDEYWLALCSVTGSTDDFARIAEKRFVARGWKSNGILKKKNSSGGNWYGFIRLTRCPAIIFETAFVDNPTSAAKIDTLAENQDIGKDYALAIVEYYGVDSVPKPVPRPNTPPSTSGGIEEDGEWGRETTLMTQRKLGLRIVDGEISNQYLPNKGYFPGVVGSWEWLNYVNRAGSNTIRAIQDLVGSSKDGIAGADTALKMQKFLNRIMGAGLREDGVAGTLTVTAWQKWLNR